MDKAIIFGGFDFLGFYLCEAFLEMGIQVDCVLLQDGDALFLEDKRFLVGRNSNFSEISLEGWSKSLIPSAEKILIAISFFDLFLKKERTKIAVTIEQILTDFFSNREIVNYQVLLLGSIQMLAIEGTERNDEFLRAYDDLYMELQNRKIPYKCIFLPTLYGPWQPLDNIFQQAIHNEVIGVLDKVVELTEREWVQDAIFVVDAINEIMNILENNTVKTSLFTSSCQDHWGKCAKFLSIDQQIAENRLKIRKMAKDIPTIEVKESIGYEQGLILQKRHLVNLFSQLI